MTEFGQINALNRKKLSFLTRTVVETGVGGELGAF